MRKQLRHPWYLWPNRPVKSASDVCGNTTPRAVETVRIAVDPASGSVVRLVRAAPTPALSSRFDQPADDEGSKVVVRLSPRRQDPLTLASPERLGG